MARIFRAAIFMTCFLSAGSAFAGTYYIAANGSDSNNGTSKTTPWAHAPGMPNCASNCGTHTPAAGDQFIFRGRDTWHFGNSSANPYTGGTWSWAWSGSSGSPIYLGVDQTWYSGGSWARPMLSGDNPLSTSTTLSSCTYQIGSNNNMVSWGGYLSYITFDNFEMLGMCQSSSGAPNGWDQFLTYGYSAIDFSNLYVHGWTHVQFSCSSGPIGQCINLCVFRGGAVTAPGSTYKYIVVDGSDSDPAGAMVFYADGYDVSYSVFRYAAQVIVRLPHVWHDNLMEYWYDPGDNDAHGNMWESVGDAPGTNAVYNNVFRNISPNGVGQVTIWPEPPVGTTGYWFNNIVYENHNGGNYFNVGQNSNIGNQGTLIIFNNTFEQYTSGYPILDCGVGGYAEPFTAVNNHYILDGSSPYASPCSGNGTHVTELAQTHATAATYGYTGSETYAYSPTLVSNPTVGKGTNEGAYCAALATAGLSAAATACHSDTTYGASYNVINHTVTGSVRTVVARPTAGAWDVGPYQYSTAAAAAPNPPTGLTATIQ